MKDFELKIEYLDIDKLTPYEGNARKHQDLDVSTIKNSISEFGMCDPIGIWSDKNIIVEGHGRLMALKQLGIEKAPCIRLDHLSDDQRREYALAHNKTAEMSEWDWDKLKDELAELAESGMDMTKFGFDAIMDELENPEIVEDDNVEVDDESETKTKFGDVWQLGKHRLMCGDSTNKFSVDILMNGQRADLYLTDPPYNVNYTGKDENELKILNDSFESDEECGEALWLPAFINAREVSKDCCSVYCFMPQGGTHMMMMMMMSKAGWQVKHELIWLKQSIVLNRADYNYQHEPFLYGWNKTHQFFGNGKFKNTSVWQFDRPTKSKEHPTMKPVELFGEILKNSTAKSNIVLDTFAGSGTSFIACEQLDRICHGMELDPKYCDVIIRRYVRFKNSSEGVYRLNADGTSTPFDEVFDGNV